MMTMRFPAASPSFWRQQVCHLNAQRMYEYMNWADQNVSARDLCCTYVSVSEGLLCMADAWLVASAAC